MRGRIAGFARPPAFTVLLTARDAREETLIPAVESVRRQLYPRWELFVVCDASTAMRARPALERLEREDSRVKTRFVVSGDAVLEAANDALASAAGDFAVVLGQDDRLAEHALYWLAEESVAHPEAELIYSDEDEIRAGGRRSRPYFKPDWDPELLLGQDYVVRLGAFRRRRVLELGGFRAGFEGAQEWDLALRFVEGISPRCVRRVPAVLYHRGRVCDPASTAAAGRRGVAEALSRRGERARLDSIRGGPWLLPRFAPRGKPLVTLVIPTRNHGGMLRRCLDSLKKTSYPNLEILVIDNQSDDPKTLSFLEELGRRPGFRVVSDPFPFSYAGMHNRVVPLAKGDYVCLLNNDVEVASAEWLDDMLGAAQRPGVGAVGAKLLYSDTTVQHGGVLLGVGGIAGHAHRFFLPDSSGYQGRGALQQSFSAVTAACMLLRKEHWVAAGGMSEDLSVAYNDVDLCLRLRERGLRNVWVPSAVLIHHESQSRASDVAADALPRYRVECAYMQWRWGALLGADPAYNPNLGLKTEDFALAFPPRARRPWLAEPLSVDVPYGVPPGLEPEARALGPGEEVSGSFRVPRGLAGTLTGVTIRIGSDGGPDGGRLTVDLRDEAGGVASGRADLAAGSEDAVLTFPLSGELHLRGQERLNFRFGLENANRPIALWTHRLNDAWGHDGEMAFQLSLHVASEN
ncbi:MAG: glycosyltransferase family 2 protein [Elusimicrobiota bacterium]